MVVAVGHVYDPGDGTGLALRIVNRDGSPVSAGGGGGTSSTDDAAFTAGASSLTPVGGIVTSDSVDSGDAGAFKMLANRQQVVTLADAGGDQADVLDLTNSNPLAVAIVDSSGDQISSFGGGTQYTEDAAAAANPVGTALIMVREDARAGSLTTTDGDNVAARGTNAGELYVKHVDSIAVTNAGLTELAAAIDTEVQVDVVGALPSGDNNIGNVDIVSLPNEGQQTMANSISVAIASNQSAVAVDGSGVTQPVSHAALTELAAAINGSSQMDVNVAAGTVAVTHAALTELGTALVDEDTAHQSGDKGLAVWAVRQSSQADFAADGDYLPFSINDDGELRVTMAGGSGGTAAADDADFSAGSTQGTPAMGVYESTPSAVTDGDMGIAGLTEHRALKVALVDFAGAEVSVGGGTQYDEDTASDSGQKITMAGVTRADTAATQVNTDGDRSTLIVDASGRLHVNVGNTVTVGSHAVTNAGTFATQVDGAALTALQLIDDPVATLGTTTYSETTTKGMIVGAVRRDADTTLVDTTNEIGPLQMDANGRLKVEAFSGETLPVSLASVPSHAVTNAGTFAVQVDGAALTALQLIDNPVLVDDAAFTPAASSVMMAGFEADESSTDSVDEGDAGAARMTLDRKQIVTVLPHTSGGLSTMNATSSDGATALTSTAQVIKASAGQLFGYFIYNPNASAQFVQFYNTAAASVTVGTTNPLFMLTIPATSAANLMTPHGIAFSNAGWSWAATSTAGGNGAPSTALDAVAFYA